MTMACPQTEWLSNEAFLRKFNRKAREARIPVQGSFEITRRCNLNCAHCYLGGHSSGADQKRSELTTDQVLAVIDQMAAAGCLFLLLTGGEPLLRRDFAQIYTHARSKGMMVTVFSNGTLIDSEAIALFKKYPPYQVEISLYGATPGVYERITGVRGSFQRCLAGIEALQASGVRFGLKSILMRQNCEEMVEIEKLAMDYCGRFRFDAAIFPTIKGDPSPMAYRVEPARVVNLEMANTGRRAEWREFLERYKDFQASDNLYQCGAGMTLFHVSASGDLQPCMMASGYGHDLLHSGFAAGWKGFAENFRNRKAPPSYQCNDCDKMMLCNFCPAFFNLETGSEAVASDYLCRLGHERYKSLKFEDCFIDKSIG